MAIDTSNIDADTTFGQIIILIAVIISGAATLRPVFRDLRKGRERKNCRVIASELESVKKELGFALQVQRHAMEWQLVAREYIRVSRLELANAGVEINENLQNLHKRLEEIDDRDIYSEHILIKEEDEE